MEDAQSIVLPPGVSGGDDLGERRVFELFAVAAGARWAELEIRSKRSKGHRTLTFGTAEPPTFTAELAIDDDTTGGLAFAGDTPPTKRVLGLLTDSLERELHRLRLLAESTLLRSALNATTAAVLVFGPSGTILYANRKADELISKQTEDELTADVDGRRPQPLFEILCAKVGELLDDPDGRAWRHRLELSDGSELSGELEALSTEEDGLGRIVLAVLREISNSPNRRVEDFASHYRLSPREREVLLLLVQGLDTVALADRLGISPHTVRDHLKNVFRKTSNRSRSELLSALAVASEHNR
jgi:DNA-binding CsgD family transcriptional regulator